MTLRPYQADLVDVILRDDGIGVFLDPGMGKTLIVLKALERLKKEGKKPIKVFILGPIRVIETVWRQEAKKWNIDLSFSLVRGSPRDRERALAMDRDVYLVNFEMIPWLFEKDKRWNKRKFGKVDQILVVDESTMLKSHRTQRWRKLKPQLKYFAKRIILTGTPIPNTYLDLWTQIGILDFGQRLERSFTRYQNTYFEQDYSGFVWTPRSGSIQTINERIVDITHRAELPPELLKEPVEVARDFDLTPTEWAKYKEMERDAIAEFYDEVGDEEVEIPALSAAALHSKLSQLAQGFIYDPEKNPIEFHNRKTDIFADTVEELNGKGCVYVYKFIHEVTRLKDRFGKEVVVINEDDAAKLVDRWNEGKIRIFAIHPRSGGHGLNLQFGGSHMFMSSPMYNGEHYDQVIRRLLRPGQTDPVVVEVARAIGTVDMSIQNKLDERTNTMKSFLDYVASVRKS